MDSNREAQLTMIKNSYWSTLLSSDTKRGLALNNHPPHSRSWNKRAASSYVDRTLL
jgi:hypothetical protein